MTLAARLSLACLLVALLSVTALFFGARHLSHAFFRTYLAESQQSFMQSLARDAEAAFRDDGSLDPVAAKIAGAAALENGILLQFLDGEGALLWCMHCDNEESCRRILGGIREISEACFPGGGGAMEKTRPVERNGRPLGSIRLRYYGPAWYRQAEADFLRETDRGFLVCGLLAAFAALATGLLLARRIARPVRDVADQTDALAAGAYDRRVTVRPDTAEIRRLAGSVNRLAERLEHEDALRRRLLGDYAHELRTPLTVLASCLEAMQDGIRSPSPENFEICRRETARLAGLVQDIDDVLALRSPEGRVRRTSFDLAALCGEIGAAFEAPLKERGISLELPPAPCPVTADRERIGQALYNLLSNALRYTGDGGRIRVAAERRDGAVRLSVADNGMGVAAEDLPWVFDYLYRSDASRAVCSGGRGIGLSLVKAIAEAHGGTAQVESEPGRGSTFAIVLPDRDPRQGGGPSGPPVWARRRGAACPPPLTRRAGRKAHGPGRVLQKSPVRVRPAPSGRDEDAPDAAPDRAAS